MKRIVLVLLVAALVIPVAACRGRRVVATNRPMAPAAVPVVIVPSEAPPSAIIVEPEATAEVVFVEATGVVVEEAEPPPDPEAYLADVARATEIERQKREVLARDYLAKAEEALSSGDIEGARHWYGEVLHLDPGHVVARRGLRNISGDRASTVGEFLDQTRSIETVRRQQAAAQVRNFLERGKTFEGRDDYDSAIQEYQKALAIVSWYTDQRDFGVTADRVRDLIENAKHKAAVSERLARQEQIRAAQQEREHELAGEKERRFNKIRAYFDGARNAFRRGEYGAAREYSKQILLLDPQNTDAEQLLAISYDAEHTAGMEQARRVFDDQWEEVFQSLEDSTLPQTEVVIFPDDWLDGIAQRTPRVVGDVVQEDDASIAAILTTLDTKRVKGLDWEDQNLDQVVSYLRTITGLNFFITPKVRAEVYDEVEVTLQLDDVTIRTVLDLVTQPYELRWSPENGVVKIATKDEVRGDMYIRYFDIKDLTVAIESYVGGDINLVPSNFTPPEPPELPEPMPIYPEDGLIELIQQTIGAEDAWEDPASIEVRNRIIIARNTSPLLDKVESLLDELRRNSGLLVNLEVRFLTVEDNFLQDVGVDVRGLGDNSQGIGQPGLGQNAPMDDLFYGSPANPYGVPFGVFPEPSSAGTGNESGILYDDGGDGAYMGRVENLFDTLLGNPDVLTGSGGLSFQTVYLDDTQIEVILRAVEKTERIQQITASRITVYNTQRANISVLNQVSYVQDYEVEIAQASNIANPVIQTIQDGVVLDVRPVVSADLRFVTLELRPTVALLTRPIATFSTSLASGPVMAAAPVVIQIPELSVSRVRTTVVMPDGATLLLGGLKFYEQVTQDSSVPILSDIPFLCFLFSRKGTYVNRRNLIVLITAQIVPLEELEPRSNLDLPPAPASDYVPLREFEPCDPCRRPPPGDPRTSAGPRPPFGYGR